MIDRAAARLKSGVSVPEMGPYVGATGFEPAASRSQSGRSAKLSYAPGGLARMCVLIGPKKSSRRARTPLPVGSGAQIRCRDQEIRPIQDENAPSILNWSIRLNSATTAAMSGTLAGVV